MTQPRTLETVRIARPCPARWEEMAGDDRVRFCGLCRKNVYNLSALSREDATRLLEEKEGQLCGLFYRRRDGTVLTSDCPVGAKAFAARVVRRVVTALTSLLLILGYRDLAPEFGEGGPAGRKESSHAPFPGGSEKLSPEVMERLRELGSLSYVEDGNSGDRRSPEVTQEPGDASETSDAQRDPEAGLRRDP